MSPAHDSIGFVGLGHMGGNMAVRYLAAGYPVFGEARSKDGLDQLLQDGLGWRDTPREVAESADIVITSIPNDDVLREIASGDDGIMAGLEAGKVWVDMSTVSPGASREVAKQAEETGARVLDAPVSGSVPQVKSGR
jgi:3-hydroxyisobutyrate dehydrogenase